MTTKKIVLTALVIFATATLAQAQSDRKVTFVGGARSLILNNQIAVNDTIVDTTTIGKNQGGYALIDLGVNIKPNKNTEVMGMFRIRNELGGFWGAGVSFDVRQLWVKGIVADVVRYQLGDINIKQTPFTLYNSHADRVDSLPSVFGLQSNIINYERFYQDNTWRTQGANVDFGLSFAKVIKETNFNFSLSRLNATNFSTVPDRLMGGITLELIQSKYLIIGYNRNTVFDVSGTIADSNLFRNDVNTLNAKITLPVLHNNIAIYGEAGKSAHYYTADTLAPDLRDYFIHGYVQYKAKKQNFWVNVGYLNVGPDFRSIGAQSKDVNYNASPLFFTRYTNGQVGRPSSIMDFISNEELYNQSVSVRLQDYDPIYNNVNPYGLATFNRLGAYIAANYITKNKITINAQYLTLNEIRGQGTLNLKQFQNLKAFAMLPINELIGYKRKFILQAATNLQMTQRNSNEAVEEMDLTSNQLSLGIDFEFYPKAELLLGFVSQNAIGNDFLADRNSYAEVINFTNTNYDLQQTVIAAGLRYNLSKKSQLTVLYQKGNYKNNLATTAGFDLNKFGIYYIIAF